MSILNGITNGSSGSGDGGGSFTAGGDLTGSSSSQQVVSLQGSGTFVQVPSGTTFRSTGSINFKTEGFTVSVRKLSGLNGNEIVGDGTYLYLGNSATSTQVGGGNVTLTVSANSLVIRFAGVWGFTSDLTTTDTNWLGTSNLTSLTYGFADAATASGVGAPLILAGQRNSGSNSKGGDLNLTVGTGMLSNGNLKLTNVQTAAGAAFATADGFIKVTLNGTVVQIPYKL